MGQEANHRTALGARQPELGLCWLWFYPLTNGRIAAHTMLAVVPAINTFLLTMQLGYLVVGLAEKIWQSHLRTWWNHPVNGR